MPDHVHLLVKGLGGDSDGRAFIKAAKQYSGYCYKQSHRQRLWQRYGFERTIRDDRERALVIGYIIANPVRSGLVTHPAEYPYLGSQCYTVAEMLEVCGYRSGV